MLPRDVRRSGMICEAGDRARDRPGGYAEAPNFHLDGDTKRTGFQNQSHTIQSSRAGWPRTRSSDQSERCTKETSTCDKSQEDSTQKVEAVPGAQENPSMSWKKVTTCNRCGAIGHWEEDCSQNVRSRRRDPLCKRQRKKSSVQERKI